MGFKRKISLALFPLLLQAGCNNQSSVGNTIADSRQSATVVNPDTLHIEKETLNCYQYVIKRDTILLQLRQRGDSITGTMSFDNYEKDSSHGDIMGYVNKDTIYVLYDFSSEGMRSTMEIALLKEGSSLIRGIGPMVNKGDTVLYRDHQSISYHGEQQLDLVNCTTARVNAQ